MPKTDMYQHAHFLSDKRKKKDAKGDDQGISVGTPYRQYGSTHQSPSKDALRRNISKAERQKSKKLLKKGED